VVGYVVEDKAFYLRFRFRGRSALPGARARSSRRIRARGSLRRTARRSVKLASRFRRLRTLNHRERPRMNVNAGRSGEGGACPVAGRSGGRGQRRGLDMLLKIIIFAPFPLSRKVGTSWRPGIVELPDQGSRLTAESRELAAKVRQRAPSRQALQGRHFHRGEHRSRRETLPVRPLRALRGEIIRACLPSPPRMQGPPGDPLSSSRTALPAVEPSCPRFAHRCRSDTD